MNGNILSQFLAEVDGMTRSRKDAQLSQYIIVEPDQHGNFPEHYQSMIQDVRTGFPANKDDALEQFCSSKLPTAREGAEGMPWNEFTRFMVAYLRYLTLVDPQNLLSTYKQLTNLVE